MDTDNFEHLLNLVGENFYVHIQENFGKNVEKVLRFHDIDNFTLLGGIDEHQLIDIFEKPNDSTSSSQLVQLKYEICNLSEEIVSMKIGTKNKLIVLLKSIKDILKKKKQKTTQQAQLNRTSEHRSTSPSNNSSTTNLEISHEEHHSYINQSIEKLLEIMKYNIHGITDTNISANNFQVIIENPDDYSEPTCSIKCICKDRIKLYQKNKHFQISNLQKHLKTMKKNLSISIGNDNQQTEDSEDFRQSSVNNEILTTQSNPSITQSTLRNYIHIENNNFDESISTKIKKAQKLKSSITLDDGKRDSVSMKPMKNQQNGQSFSQVSPKRGETQSSISIMPPSKLKKQSRNNEITKTKNLTSTLLYSKSIKEQNSSSHNHSQSKKRKATDNDDEVENSSMYLLPSIKTVKNFYTCNAYVEGKFRYEEAKNYLDSIGSNFIFISEDCSAIIPRVEYNSTSNDFNGFVTQMIDGKPIENYFQCNTFEELKYMFENIPQATLVNAYTQSHIPLLDRIYYAFIVLFYVRLWRIWLFITRRTRIKSTTRKSNTDEKLNHFITSNALLCIEINSHFLLYTYLLIKEKIIPKSVGQSIHLFSSQDCENVFRDARALSGIYSTRINFTMKQFLKRIDKLNALTKLKQFESNNEQEKITFPIYHKIKQHTFSAGIDVNDEEFDCSLIDVEAIILQAYDVAQRMSIYVGMDKELMKKNLFDIEKSSQMAKQLLKLNNLTESEVMTIDDPSGIDDIDDDEEEEDADEEIESQGDDQEDDNQEVDNQKYGNRDDDDQEDDDGTEADIINPDYIEDNTGEEDIEGDSIDEDVNDESCDYIYDYNSSEDNEETTITFENVQTESFSGLRLLKSIPQSTVQKYFPIVIRNRKMFLHKSTATWYLQDKQFRLSCDRLRRVQFRKKTS
ncbi:unnamed protein product [Rotaria sordida]|uniref:Uncharacterized protein n=1 Tax=Rotaria sordida TaxID=392033 RepID=A0A815Q333_9BILA|nr:unnamed protein product [Rotaria sordida]